MTGRPFRADLGLNARLLTYLATHPTICGARRLAPKVKAGPTSVQAALDRLLEYGYLVESADEYGDKTLLLTPKARTLRRRTNVLARRAERAAAKASAE